MSRPRPARRGGVGPRLAALALLVALPAGAMARARAPLPRGPWLVYFGTYTKEKSRGIYVASFDAETGRAGPPRLAAETENPSFLALHPTRPLLYAVNEVDSF